jgi:hypothetical protein
MGSSADLEAMVNTKISSIFKHPVACHIKQSMYIKSVRNATNYFFFPLSLNTICFGPMWPSSGV